MVIGNIVGSNILNLVVIVPIIGIFSSAIMPIELWEEFISINNFNSNFHLNNAFPIQERNIKVFGVFLDFYF